MRMDLAFLFVAAMVAPGIAFPLEHTESSDRDIGFTVGLTEYQVREEVLNNIRHRGLSISLGFSHERPGELSRKKLELYFVFNSLKSRYDPEKDSFVLNSSVTYRYARKCKDISRNIKAYLGGMAGFHSNIAFFENWDESHAYWLTSYDLSIDGILTYHKSDNSSFSLEVDLPVLALVSRPPARILYKESSTDFSWIMGKLHENMKLTSLHRHFAIDLNVGYAFQLTEKCKQKVFWRFGYLHNELSYSKDVTILMHTFGASFLF